MATETNARGIVKTLSYDAATGQLTGISFSDDETPSQSFAYNILGQLTQVTDAAGTRTIAYNEYSEQQSDSLNSGAHTHLVTELRDSYGRSTGFTYARSGSTQFTTSVGYATDGRIATAGFMHGGVNRQFSYGYLSGSNLLHTLTHPNGLTLTQSYEEHRDLLTDMQYHRGSTLVVERSYSGDKAPDGCKGDWTNAQHLPEGRGAVGRLRVTLGRPTNRSTARQGSVKNDSFTHNDRSELTAATLGTDAYSYSYDNIGNRKTAQEAAEEATAYDANNLNQYTAIQTGEEAAFVPTFDADGNQTKVKTSTGIWNVVYNAENRPVTFTSEDGATVVECTYDYMGRRHTRKITVNGSVTNYLRYIYRGYLQIAAINAVSGVFQWFILWDPTQPDATRPLGIRKDGTWYTYGWDLTKNICELYSTGGTIYTSYTYTPFGFVTASGSLIQPIQWSSEVWDSELGLVYYNWRYYNAMDGRWLKRDLVHSNNLYTYVKSAPILLFDLLGLDDPPYWSPTANMPINSPSTQSTTPSGKGKTDVTPLPKSDILVFDGKKICIMKYDFSECLACWEAASGRNPDAIDSLSKETQKRKNFGPIPEGKYIVPWTNMEYPDNPEGIWSTKEWNKYAGRWNAFWENMKHDFDISRRSKRKETAWGNYAVRLIAADGTETYGRTHFNIHGGAEKGSAGCIDIGKNDTTFFQKIKTYKDALYLYVDYTGEKSKQCDNCSLYYKNAWSK